MNIKKIIAAGAGTMLASAMATGAMAQVKSDGTTTVFTAPAQSSAASAAIDYQNAKPVPGRMIGGSGVSAANAGVSAQSFGAPSATPGSDGTGKASPIRLFTPAAGVQITDDGVSSQEFGTSLQPFTTNEANAFGVLTERYYPFRAAGKLFFNIGASSFVCSASLIKPGLVVTAAHCVANFGQNQFYSNWRFVPAYRAGVAPFGSWTVLQARVLTSYLNGTDSCAVSGVVCQDDVAVLALNPQSGAYAGNTTGWYGFGINGYSYNSSKQALITQLGYPVALDNGNVMQRTDSQGFTSASNSNNTLIGSLQTGGSSGGPWVVNLGRQPVLSGISFGTAPVRNIVVGVTSWGFTNSAVKQQGASPFTAGNISNMVSAQCAATPGVC